MISEKNQIALIWLGTITLAVVGGYVFYKSTSKKPTVVDNASVDENEIINTTPTPAPKVNPFTSLLGKKFAPINFKPTDYSVKNPFADVNTAIANVNPFSSSNTGERLA
jgi:hypothetical protein